LLYFYRIYFFGPAKHQLPRLGSAVSRSALGWPALRRPGRMGAGHFGSPALSVDHVGLPLLLNADRQ
jgi:hypothetical protein